MQDIFTGISCIFIFVYPRLMNSTIPDLYYPFPSIFGHTEQDSNLTIF